MPKIQPDPPANLENPASPSTPSKPASPPAVMLLIRRRRPHLPKTPRPLLHQILPRQRRRARPRPNHRRHRMAPPPNRPARSRHLLHPPRPNAPTSSPTSKTPSNAKAPFKRRNLSHLQKRSPNISLQERRLTNQLDKAVAKLEALQKERKDARQKELARAEKSIKACALNNLLPDMEYFGFDFSIEEFETFSARSKNFLHPHRRQIHELRPIPHRIPHPSRRK